jgi:cytoskeletal protein CcmA (bactofilin family)
LNIDQWCVALRGSGNLHSGDTNVFNRPPIVPLRESESKKAVNGSAHPISETINSSAIPLPAPSKTMSVEKSEKSHLSIIGNDLAIMGERIVIITKGALQIDGEVEADLHCAEVIIGEAGKVTGTIWADVVEVRGRVYGTIKGTTVHLMGKSTVEGDIHHQNLAVVEGASFDGRVRRPKDLADLKPTLDPKLHAGTPNIAA